MLAIKGTSSHVFLFAKGYRLMTSGWQGAPCFRRYGRGLVSKPTISLKKKLGGFYRRTTQGCVLSCLDVLKRGTSGKKVVHLLYRSIRPGFCFRRGRSALGGFFAIIGESLSGTFLPYDAPNVDA